MIGKVGVKMANLMDYLQWRGDIPFAVLPPCDVDYLILCRMVYAPFDGVVSESFAQPITICEAARRVLELTEALGDGRKFRIPQDEELLRLLMSSPRFAQAGIAGFRNILDPDNEEQFCAAAIRLPAGGNIAVFRGTDGTLTGWKEDFNMAFSGAVPAQRDAVAYIEAMSEAVAGPIMSCGHSKGGNLALYSAAFCSGKCQRRITAVRNFDGPGFSEENYRSSGMQNIIGVTHTFLPQSSVVGMLLEHAEDFTVIESRSVGIYQHNPYMWEIFRDGFVMVESRTNSSRYIDTALKEWVANMTPELREKMINGAYSVLRATDACMISELLRGHNPIAIVKAFHELDDDTRAVILEGLQILRGALKSSFPVLMDRLREKSSEEMNGSEPSERSD